MIFIFFVIFPIFLNSQILPSVTDYNQDIVWESVFTSGPAGKVNRGIVDSDGNCAVVFMPEDMARIHKVDGSTGQLIWTKNINNKIGFGITEFYDAGRVDYIVSGGSGNTQERWVARLNGDDGSIIWDNTYNYSGSQWQYDGIRMTIIGSDNYIYASGFVNGDESGTIFIVYAGQAVVMKIDPSDGSEIWSHIHSLSEYSVALVESSDGYIYSGGDIYGADLTLTKLDKSGNEIWYTDISNTEEIIPADLAISNNDVIYYGGHSGRSGPGDPFDYSCVSLDTNANVNSFIWKKHYANPRGYSLDHIRNELYGIKVGTDGIYMFGGTGDEGSYSATNSPFLSSDIWNGWVLSVDTNGDILNSYVYCQGQSNTATEYGYLIENGFVIFNDTDAQGDEEVGVMKIINGSNPALYINNNYNLNKKNLLKEVDVLGREIIKNKNILIFKIYEDGSVEKEIIID